MAGHLRPAGRFEGNVQVQGDLNIEPGAHITGEPRKMVTMKMILAGVCLLVVGMGCTERLDTTAPDPPPPSPRSPPPPSPRSPPPLSPRIDREESQKLREDAESRIAAAEQIVTQVDEKKLSNEQQETLVAIQDLLSKAREALSVGDYGQAFNLADKAKILADGLPTPPR